MAENDDSESWSLLDNDGIESIFKRLPLDSVAMFRFVKREWNNLPSAEHFLTWRRKIFKEHQWLLLIRKIPNDGSNYYRLNVLTKTLKPFHLDPLVLASVGGLVVRTDIARSRLFLCNPLTGTETQITERGHNLREKSVMVCNPVTETFFQLPVTIFNKDHGRTVGNILWNGSQYEVVALHKTTIQVYDFASL
ncbi:hypothetical protein SUGI_0544580 [Cryptomeria japonica]|nr:hypothetical protein SUGI_0544580 [Cryptomeria japonica]